MSRILAMAISAWICVSDFARRSLRNCSPRSAVEATLSAARGALSSGNGITIIPTSCSSIVDAIFCLSSSGNGITTILTSCSSIVDAISCLYGLGLTEGQGNMS